MAGMVTIFGYSIPFQVFWFLPVFLGFAILGGIFPFHNWSPDGHVAAPTAETAVQAHRPPARSQLGEVPNSARYEVSSLRSGDTK